MPVRSATVSAFHVLIGPRSRRRFAVCVGCASSRISASVRSARWGRRRRIGIPELLGDESSALRLVQFDVTSYLARLIIAEDLTDRGQREI
eukprot:3634206-Pleurochrysis_carterae.AAC.2